MSRRSQHCPPRKQVAKASTRVAFNVTVPQRLRLFAEVAAGWINKPPPQEKKEASIVPGSSFTPSSVGWLPRKYLQKRNSAFADHGAIVCVGAHSAAPQFLRSHTHASTCPIYRGQHISLNSKKQFRGIPRCHTHSGVWLAGQKHESVFGTANDGTAAQSDLGPKGKRAGFTVMRRSLASRDWDVYTLVS